MENLIEALQIFLKYDNLTYPINCGHEVLLVMIDPSKVSQEDIAKLDRLGFFVGKEFPDCFTSFRYGST